jgi:hypothetical protein
VARGGISLVAPRSPAPHPAQPQPSQNRPSLMLTTDIVSVSGKWLSKGSFWPQLLCLTLDSCHHPLC